MSRRNFLTTSTVTVGALAGGSALLSACNTSNNASSDGTTTLTVMYASNELTKAHIAEFEKLNKDIKIKFIEYDETRLNAMLVGNTPPDFVRGAGVGSANRNARGLALALDKYLEKSTVLKKDDLLDINNTWRWDGKQVGQGSYYGISKDWSQDHTIWYNQSFFEQAKITPFSTTEPTSYDEIFSVAGKLKQSSGGKTSVYGYGTQWAWGIPNLVSSMILQQGGTIFNADSTEANYTTAEAKKAIEWFVNYVQAGLGPSSLDPAPDKWDGPFFLGKRMAIMMSGYWFGGNVLTATDEIKTSAKFAPAPMMGSKRFSPSVAGIGAWIPAKSKNQDAAWKLMEYFMAGTPGHERARSGWGIPSLKSLLPDMPQDLPYQKEAYAAMQGELKYVGILPDSPYASLGSFATAFDTYITDAGKKTITVDVACQKITEDVNKLLVQGKKQLS
jgi:multiple sugar transport system substrate-binding protein